MEEKRLELENHIMIINGLINYHKRMVSPISQMACVASENCPVLSFENDIYLAALEASLELLKRELVGLGR